MDKKINTGFWNAKAPEYALSIEPIGRGETALYFLHGVCGVFALALHNIFGYQIEVAAEMNMDGAPWEERIVHIYCRDNQNNFVDVRGVTNDEDLFIESFEDFFVPKYGDYLDIQAEELRSFLSRCMDEDELSWLYNAAVLFIHRHGEYKIEGGM